MEDTEPVSNFSKNIDSMITKKEEREKNNKTISGDLQMFITICYIGSALLLLLGAGMIFYGLSEISSVSPIEGMPDFFGKYLIYSGSINIIIAIVLFFMARGMKKREKWIRPTAIILSSIGIMTSIFSIIKGGY